MRFLDNDIVDFGGVRFIDTALWTDYRLTLNRLKSELMDVAERRISDHHRIRFRGRALTARDALAEHESSRAWLERALDTQGDFYKSRLVRQHFPTGFHFLKFSDGGEFLPVFCTPRACCG